MKAKALVHAALIDLPSVGLLQVKAQRDDFPAEIEREG